MNYRKPKPHSIILLRDVITESRDYAVGDIISKNNGAKFKITKMSNNYFEAVTDCGFRISGNFQKLNKYS